MKARIYQPTPSATQSGRARSRHWVLEYETETPRRPEPLMGWTSSGDTLNQVRMRVDSREEAEAFAREHGLDYTVKAARQRRIPPKNYGDNFRRDRPRR